VIGMRLLTLPGVFRPRRDSWLLAGAVAHRARAGEAVLDPFAGSGVVALAAALGGASTTAMDVSRRAVICARLNARLNGVRMEVRRAGELDSLGERRFDLIAANPPYVFSGDKPPLGAARAWAGGPDGRRFVDRLCAEAHRRLMPGGTLLLVHSSLCGERRTLQALESAGLAASVIVREPGPIGPLMSAAFNHRSRNGQGAVPRHEELLVFEAVREMRLDRGRYSMDVAERRGHPARL
jgi:release factor glutamine methyltransferase